MSYFELYNKMRQMARMVRGSSKYQAGWRPQQAHGGRETGFRCPRCADMLERDARCLLCGVHAVPRDATRTDAHTSLVHFLRRAHRVGPSLRFWNRAGAQRKQAAKLRHARQRYPRVRALDSLVGEAGRFRGQLTVLAPVVEPSEGRQCGAYVSSRVETERCACKPTCESVTQWSNYESDAGLLTLTDGKHTAFIGLAGPRISVWTTQRLDPNTLVLAHTGDEVEFIGRLRERREVTVELGASTYRDAAVTHLSLESPRRGRGWLVLQPE